MNHFTSALAAYFRVSVAIMFQYRAEIVLWAVWGVVYPAVALAMWSAAIAGSAEESIGGYGIREFAGYFLLTMVVGHLGTAWDIYEMGYYIRSGRMSTRLLKPILPIWWSLTDNIAYKTLTMAILVPVWLIVAWLTKPAIQTDATRLALGTTAVFLGSGLTFLWGYDLALAAFWVTKMEALGEFWFGLSLFFGGRLAPLPVLPPFLQDVAAVLPVKWMVWFPAEAMLGRMSVTEIAWGLGAQVAWMAGGLIVFRLTWRAAVKRYTAVGI